MLQMEYSHYNSYFVREYTSDDTEAPRAYVSYGWNYEILMDKPTEG